MTALDLSTSPPPFARQVEKRYTPFSDEEYEGRLSAVKKDMDRAGVDCFFVSEGGNICYLCGYAAESDYVAQGLAIFGDQHYPDLFLRRSDGPAGMYMAFMPNEHVIDYPERYVGDPDRSGFDFVFDSVSRRGVKRVGLEFDSISAVTLDTLRERFPNITLVDMSGSVSLHRLIKSPTEISVQREASLIIDSVMEQTRGFFEPGRREADVAADITAGLIRGTSDFHGEPTDAVLMPGGRRSGTAHIPWTDDHISKGIHYNLEVGAARYRYFSALMRTISIGVPGDRLSHLHSYMMEGCDEALAAVKPGATCADVARAYCQTIEKGGYWKDSRCGYPMGINWLEDSCSLRTDDKTVLEQGMVFHLMLGTWLEEDFGAVLSETFVVTGTGCEVFGQFPRELVVI